MATRTIKQIDWVVIERDFRAGIKSNRQIADEHDISETMIRKRAIKYEWVKDLAAAIRAKAAEKVREQEVRTRFAKTPTANQVEQDPEEAQIIEENALIQAAVITSHRKHIGKAQMVAQMLFEELETAVLNPGELEQFAEMRAMQNTQNVPADAQAKMQAQLLSIYTKIMELPSKAGVIDKLANTLSKLITLERQAFNIDEKVSAARTLESFLEELD